MGATVNVDITTSFFSKVDSHFWKKIYRCVIGRL